MSKNTLIGILACGTIVLAALAAVPAQSALADEVAAEDPIFYPMPPQLPRLQFLKAFTSSLDSSEKNKGMRDFLFGGKENERSLIQKPYGVAIHQGAIHAVDTRGNGWGVFDLANGRSYFVRPSGGGTLQKPINIAIDANGTKYVTDTVRQQVVVFDASDKYVTAFGEPEQFKPVDVAVVGDRLYVTDVLHHKVHVLDKQSGETLLSFGEPGSAPGEFMHPTGVAIGPDGRIYVVDTTNFRLQRFSADGDFDSEFGGQGAVPGRYTRPKSVAIDKDNHIYVVDSAFQNIQIVDEVGGALMFFGGPGNRRDSIGVPAAIRIDYENVEYFQDLAAPGFNLEYLVLVVGQFGPNKVVVFGYGVFDE